jgi:hypothetical protein
MIIRINNRQEGVIEYLKTGKRADSNLTRDEKDKVISIVGDLDQVDKLIKYINTEKKYKQAYSHITISFTEEDFEKFYDPKTDSYDIDKMQQLIDDYMQLFLAGYDKSEYTYYAELHYPKVKIENGKKRLPHFHIVTPLINLNDNTKLRPAFFSIKTNDLLQTYISKKYGMDLPIYYKRDTKNFDTKTGLTRKELKEILKDIRTRKELLNFFKQNKLKYRKVKTKKNTYYKVTIDGKNINLRGKGLEHLEEIAKYGYVKSNIKERKSIAEIYAGMSLNKLEHELKKYIDKRVEEISKRRSKKATEKLIKVKELQTDNREEENSISIIRDVKKQFQEILLEQIYNKYIPLREKGFFVKKEKDKVRVVNKKKNINVEDRGDKILIKGKNLKEQVKLALDIAEAKGWKLEEIVARGSDEFKKEVYSQIKERLLKQQQTSLSLKLPLKPSPRPTNTTENLHKEKEETKKLDKKRIKEIKENLEPREVLEYAVKHYKIDPSIYEVIGNKIKNITNRQKPKNVIDFLTKEVGVSVYEAFVVADRLYQQQLKQEQKVKVDKKVDKGITMKLSYNTYTKIDYPTKNWRIKELKSKSEIETLCKNYPYSNFIFQNGYRSSQNTAQMTSIILDFDNDDKEHLISMQEVINRLKDKGIKAFAITTKSNLKEKNGIVAERFRVIIPITQELEINLNNRNIYARAVKNFVKELGLYDNLDTGALKDIARMYRPSPSDAKSIVCNGNGIDFTKFMQQAREQLEKEKQEHLKRIENIASNISSFMYEIDKSNLTGLTYADVNKILSVPFNDLIAYFENIEKEYKEGSYKMVKTDNAKYSLISDDVIYDFKNYKAYNKISYLYNKLGVKDLMSLARRLQNITGESYIKVNEDLVKNAINKALESAKDLFNFNEIIKSECNVKFARLDIKNNTLKIADIEIQVNSKEILDKINENKQQYEQQVKQSQSWKYSL